MSINKEQSNHPSKPGHGAPSDSGKSKAEVKNVHSLDNMEEHDRIREEYTDGIDEPTQDAKKGSGVNRNYDKPDLNKPKYN